MACWAKGAWPVSAQGMGGRCYPEAGNQFDHYTVEYTFADGAKLFAFSRHMTNCWETYADYAHGSKGSAVLMTDLGEPKPRIYKSQQMIEDKPCGSMARAIPIRTTWSGRCWWTRFARTSRTTRPAGQARPTSPP